MGRSLAILWGRRAGGALFGLFAGLLIAEGGARLLDHGAYPFLSLFVSDARYGVRLEPNATAKVRSKARHVTTIHTDALGFRGRSSAGTKSAVVILGDSQMFGYGVEDDQAAAHQLALRLGKSVVAAAVPSWGPPEYVAITRELVETQEPEWVVYVANIANDWWEWAVPNARRTTAEDGFAAAVTGIPQSATTGGVIGQFTSWLRHRSHLLFAAHELWTTAGKGFALDPPAEPLLRLERDTERLRQSTDGHRSPLARSLIETRELCRSHGCKVILAVLPVDAQVDAREWKKYRSPPRPLSGADRLADDLLADAQDLKIPSIDLREPLRRVSPGAFQSDDYHLSPRGHEAVARALSESIATFTVEARK